MKPLDEYYPEFPSDVKELTDSLTNFRAELEELLKEEPENEEDKLLLQLIKNFQEDLKGLSSLERLSDAQYARIFAGMSAIDAVVEVFSAEEWDMDEDFDDEECCDEDEECSEDEVELKVEKTNGHPHGHGHGPCCGHKH